jgi:hypothetical protein
LEGFLLIYNFKSIDGQDHTKLTHLSRRTVELLGEFILCEIITGELIECLEWEGEDPATSRLTRKSVDMILDKIIEETGL